MTSAAREPWSALRAEVEACYAAPMLSRAQAIALLDVADAARQLVRRDITIEVVALCEANLIAALAALEAADSHSEQA